MSSVQAEDRWPEDNLPCWQLLWGQGSGRLSLSNDFACSNQYTKHSQLNCSLVYFSFLYLLLITSF